MYPKEEQQRVRITLASILEGVISQRLIPTIDKKRVAALEIMLQTSFVSQLIIENRDSEILDAIEAGKEIYGSQSFDQGILDVYQMGLISQEEAFKYATSPSDLKLKMEGLGAIDKDASKVKEEDETQEVASEAFNEDDIFALKS
jgi:twitching motility protein PilT